MIPPIEEAANENSPKHTASGPNTRAERDRSPWNVGRVRGICLFNSRAFFVDSLEFHSDVSICQQLVNSPRGLFDWMNTSLPAGARVYFHDLAQDAFHYYQRTGLLRADMVHTGLEEPAIRSSQTAIVIAFAAKAGPTSATVSSARKNSRLCRSVKPISIGVGWRSLT